jgi:hypothetical protein
MGLQLSLVSDDDPVRIYADMDDLPVSPRTVSPVRVGDNFDNLKRKMVKYHSKQSQSAVSDGCQDTATCMPTMSDTEAMHEANRFSIDENDEADNLSEYNEIKAVDYNESFNHYSVATESPADESYLSEALLSLSMESTVVAELSHNLVDNVVRDILKERIIGQ